MTAAEAAALRERLRVDVATFAKVVSVDVRTVRRWELGEVHPTGTAAQVMLGLHEWLQQNPDRADEAVEFVVRAAEVGGLAYLLVRLLDDVPRCQSRWNEPTR